MLLLFLVSTSIAGNQTSTLEIPFRWTPGQIEISVSINGKQPIWCILDTGSEMNILDSDVATKNLELSPAFRRYDRDFVQNITLSIGPVTMREQTAMLMPLENFKRQKRDIHGVIGHTFFERTVVTIDFKAKRLLVTPASSFRPDPRATVIPLTFVDQLPVASVTLTVAGRTVEAKLMIDTGASQAAVLRYPFMEAQELLKLTGSQTTEETVAAGQRGFLPLPVQTLKLSQWTFSDPIVSAYATRSGAGGYTETDGLMGNDVLRRFLVIFDYPNKKMYLTPNENLYSPFTLR